MCSKESQERSWRSALFKPKHQHKPLRAAHSPVTSVAVDTNTGQLEQEESTHHPAKKWLYSFRSGDPRYQILQYFSRVAGHENTFTVWRPTSSTAIQRMILQQATGKGLEIKGKSSKQGKLSGFVPYLQIHQDAHKHKVQTLSRKGRTRIFFSNAAARDVVLQQLEPLQNQLLCTVQQAKRTVKKTAHHKIIQPVVKTLQQAHANVGDQLNRSKLVEAVSSGAVLGIQKSTKGLRKSVEKVESATTAGLRKSAERLDSATVGLRKSAERLDTATVAGLRKSAERLESATLGMGKSTRDSLNAAAGRLGSMSSLVRDKSTSGGKQDDDDDEREWALKRLIWEMDDPSVRKIDDYASQDYYGIELPDRLLWKVFVVDRDISREQGSDYFTGRPSEPAFQDMNFNAIFKTRKNECKKTNQARVVLWQTSCNLDKDEDPMDPRGLIMAYEENGHVLPVVSDFDCFTMGTRGLQYDTSLPVEQVELLQWCVSQIEYILKNKNDGSQTWTSCWLEVLKNSAAKGFHPLMPRYGFGDLESYDIMERAVSHLKETGAVRHGAECFNYYFPQDLDSEFLIVSGSLGNASWQYVGVAELQKFLLQKIEQGFTFPLNPKWVLCDEGWKQIYDRLISTVEKTVQGSMDVWFPPDSGVRERIESISQLYPSGFVSAKRDPELCGTEAMDLATLKLQQYMAWRRAKSKMQAVFAFYRLLLLVRRRNAAKAVDIDSDKE